MWLVRWILVILLIVLLLTFALQNQGQNVTIKLLSWTVGPVPVYIPIIIACLVGFATVIIVALLHQFQMATEIARLHREARNLEKELAEITGKLTETEKELEELKLRRLERSRQALEMKGGSGKIKSGEDAVPPIDPTIGH